MASSTTDLSSHHNDCNQILPNYFHSKINCRTVRKDTHSSSLSLNLYLNCINQWTTLRLILACSRLCEVSSSPFYIPSGILGICRWLHSFRPVSIQLMMWSISFLCFPNILWYRFYSRSARESRSVWQICTSGAFKYMTTWLADMQFNHCTTMALPYCVPYPKIH